MRNNRDNAMCVRENLKILVYSLGHKISDIYSVGLSDILHPLVGIFARRMASYAFGIDRCGRTAR